MSAAAEIARSLSAFPDRGAGTDAERRAAVWVAEEIRRPGRREAILETFWSRPNWAMAHMWHTALGVAGSLVSVASPDVGAALLAAALVSVLADAVFGISPGRRLTPERASQNVVSPPPPRRSPDEPNVRLVITANLDVARQGLVQRPALRRAFSGLRETTGGRAPGWLAWLAIALAWALATALLRATGTGGSAVKVAQLIPTVGLVLALALLLELAGSAWGPGENDNASGVAVAIALARALDAVPPGHAAVELVVTGAGSGQDVGFRRYLRAHRDRRAANTIVLGIGPCFAGPPAWLRSDGPLVPLTYSGVLRRLCAELAVGDPGLHLSERRRRGSSPGLPARQAGLPAITLTAGDGHPAPESDEEAMERVLLAGLALADATDAYLGTVRQA